jgi:hypothetical protein
MLHTAEKEGSFELTVDNIPNVFAFFEKDHLVWVIYAFTWYQQRFMPQHSSLVLLYKLSENNTTTKIGTITTPITKIF